MNWQGRKAIIYLRVSTDEQSNNYSLSDQDMRLRKFCDHMHIQIIASFTDDFSAKTFNRPEWNKMLTAVQNHSIKANTLLFTDWSRFSRCENMGESFMMIHKLKSLGVEIMAIEQPLDLNIPENHYLLSFYITSPMVENLRRGMRTANGIRMSLKSGRWCNQAPFGYLNKRDENNKPILEIDPLKSKVVEQIFNDYLNDLPIHVIKKKAQKNGFKNHGHEAIQRIITNPLYAGLLKVQAFKDEPAQMITGIHQPIISKETFYMAKAKMDYELRPKPKMISEELMLRGVITCQQCGRMLTGCRSRGRSGAHWWYYKCNHCTGENYNADKAYAELLTILNSISLNQDEVNEFLAEVDTEMKRLITEGKKSAVKLEKEVKQLESQISSLEEKYIANKIEFTTYEKYYAIYHRDLSNKTLQLQELKKDKHNLFDLYREAIPRMKNLSYLFQNCDLVGKQELLHLLFDGLKKVKGGYRTGALFDLFSVEAATNNGLIIDEKMQSGTFDTNFPGSSLWGLPVEPYYGKVESLLRFIVKIAA